MTDSTTALELYQLRNGLCITDPVLSAKMSIIKAERPEALGDGNTGYSWDEAGMADLFGKCYNHDTRYCSQAKSWYTYDGGKWVVDSGDLLVMGKIKDFTSLMRLYCGEIEDEEKRTAYLKFVAKLGDRRFRERMMKDARDVLRIDAAEFDAHPYLINCLNGTYDLRTMSFREHSWDDYLTMQTHFEYSLQTPKCDRWEQFIKEVTCGDKDKADYLQRALGYSLLGSANEECMFILYGKTTRNGKSTLLGTIHHLLGDYASVSPVSIICKNDRAKNADSASPTVAALKGKRMVTMSESNQYGKLDEEMIKQLTGGEEISARRLYQEQMSFLPQFTLWLSCNDLPSVQDKSLFASDRVRVIEFTKHFSEEERDETLKEVFRTPEAMMGIFSWLLTGFRKYKKVRLKMSDEMKKVVRQYEKDNDIVLMFLEESCRRSDSEYIRAKLLYDTYKIWAKSNGYYVVSAKKFYASVEQHPEWSDGRKDKDGYPIYQGITLKQ